MHVAVAIVLLFSSCAFVQAHDPLTNGTSTGPAYAVYTDALEIPTNKISLSARRWSTALGPVFWLKYSAAGGEQLYLSATSGAAVSNRVLRVKLTAFGPGLSKSYKPSSFKVDVPWGPGFKYSVYKSPSSLSTCKWLSSDYAKGSYNTTLYNGISRCGSLNNGTGRGNFPMLDVVFVPPTRAVYYFAYHLTQLVNAGWSVSTGSVGHLHDDTVVLPKPPMGNAPQIDTASPDLTVTNAIYGVKKVQSFSIL